MIGLSRRIKIFPADSRKETSWSETSPSVSSRAALVSGSSAASFCLIHSTRFLRGPPGPPNFLATQKAATAADRVPHHAGSKPSGDPNKRPAVRYKGCVGSRGTISQDAMNAKRKKGPASPAFSTLRMSSCKRSTRKSAVPISAAAWAGSPIKNGVNDNEAINTCRRAGRGQLSLGALVAFGSSARWLGGVTLDGVSWSKASMDG
mmetsp:Transcript_16695/g.29856  ORF Transcript_16695/g.29856 Transcript_16695/m.29856 type:complete len:205 (+) Transcript_16695:342-956(+)